MGETLNNLTRKKTSKRKKKLWLLTNWHETKGDHGGQGTQGQSWVQLKPRGVFDTQCRLNRTPRIEGAINEVLLKQ